MKKILLLVLLISNSALAFDPGGIEGVGGGGGLLCQKDGKRQVQLLDFWEAEALYGIKLRLRDEEPRAMAARALINYCRINDSYPDKQCLNSMMRFFGEMWAGPDVDNIFVGPNINILVPPDANSVFYPKECTPVGIAQFNDLSRILKVSREYYEALGQDASGLIVHETLYRFLRLKFRVNNSMAARAITACLFAETPCPELSPTYGIPDSGSMFDCKLAASVDRPEAKILAFPIKIYFGGSTWRFQVVANGTRGLSARTFFDFDSGNAREYRNDYEPTAAFSSDKRDFNLAIFDYFEDVKFNRTFVGEEVTAINGSFDGRALSCEKVR